MIKTCAPNKLFDLPVLVFAVSFVLTCRLSAQTFTTLLRFAGGSDGGGPNGGLVLSGTTIFGTTQGGGSFGHGTVFALNFDGTGFTNLYDFTGALDGATPGAGLILSGNTLYGITTGGGSSGNGTVFSVHTDGGGFTNLHSFSALTNSTNSDGANPRAGLILLTNTLFGTAEFGGDFGAGTVFGVHTDGTGFRTLHSFGALSDSSYTNSDGAYPFVGLGSSGNVLYGTAYQGGSSGNGTVFAVHTDGTGFTNLHTFTAGIGSWPTIVNSDGALPSVELVVSDNTLFGATFTGGSGGAGTVFAMGIDGVGFTNLYQFTASSYSGLVANFTNRDGASPVNYLRLAGDTLYGCANNGGVLGGGTVFAVKTNGAAFINLHSLNGVNEGASPSGGLALLGNTLFGAASIGGSGSLEGGFKGSGSVFSVTFLPQLTITPSGANIVLTWPTIVAGLDYSGFTLQTAPDLTSPDWATNLPAQVIVNGQKTVTLPASGTPQFFRLGQ